MTIKTNIANIVIVIGILEELLNCQCQLKEYKLNTHALVTLYIGNGNPTSFMKFVLGGSLNIVILLDPSFLLPVVLVQ